MNMPGFNAEVSLYKTSGRYQIEAFKRANEAVYPARIACDECSQAYDDCLANCSTPQCEDKCKRYNDRCLGNCVTTCQYFNGTWYCF
jgi:hypothetical protein